jgi:hypothetical protein
VREERGSVWRFAVWFGLLIGWLVMVPLLWSAFASLPSEARLQQTRMAAIPTLGTFFTTLTVSVLELCVLLALLWPWRARRYGTRLALAAAAAFTWFLLTTPLSITRLQWIHRRWLFAVIVVLVAGAFVTGTVRLVRSRRPAE